jgi:hypothetical protein
MLSFLVKLTDMRKKQLPVMKLGGKIKQLAKGTNLV